MERSTETKILERQKQETQQIEDLTNGRGFSSDKTLARFFDCTRKTIWTWSREGKLPPPDKIGPNTTRWNNAKIKQWKKAGHKQFLRDTK